MSNKDKQAIRKKVAMGLRIAHEKMLREKILRGDSVIYSNRQGEPVCVDPSVALQEMLEAHPL